MSPAFLDTLSEFLEAHFWYYPDVQHSRTFTQAAQPLMSHDAGDVTFDFRDCSVTLDTQPTKPILHGVSGQVASRSLLAIMGPSGAGKTTLLNLLVSMRGASYEHRYGSVTLNGHIFTGTREARQALTLA